jgi:acetyl-CoA synthetase
MEGAWPQMFRTIWGNKERYIAVLGRPDDVLNGAGQRIGSADVESALVSHAAVAEAGVIELPDPLKGESMKAFVTLKVGWSGGEELKRAFIEHVRRELGPMSTLSALELVTGLPKTRSGKILRRVVKARELGVEREDLTTIEE